MDKKELKNSKLLQKKTKRDEEEEEEQEEAKKKPEETTFFKDEQDAEDLEEIEALNQLKHDENEQWINKTRTLIVASRGISHQERHLVNNLLGLIPNAKKECKIEKDTAREELTEVCFNHSCKYALYFEHRKRELVLWMFKAPEGPCAKFQIRNIHVLNEIKLMGNCIKYSRPLLSFDKSFDTVPHLKLLKQMFIQTFGSPRGHPKTKPFYDHILCFYNVNNQIFFRNYQVLNELKEKFKNDDPEDKMTLLEIGPRFSMNLMRIFDGPLGGKTLYQNPYYIPPSVLIKRKMDNYKKRKLKDNEEQMRLNDKLANIKEVKQKWLEE